MKRIKSVIGVLAISLLGFNAQAQQDVMFTQYMFNGLNINPAYTGSHEAISTNFIWRKQWVNFNGAPQNTALSIHSPIGGDKIGLGLQLVNDKIGSSQNMFANASASYMLPVAANTKLAFGLSAGLDKMDYNFSDLYLGVNGDPSIASNEVITGNKMNFGTGLYLYSKKSFIGLSVPRLLENDFEGDNVSYTQSRHAFLYAGYVFELHPNFKFKPNVLVKMSSNSEPSLDLNANFLFVDKLWLGVSYRTQESVDFITQYNVTDQLSLGYAYDWTLNDLKAASKGSHEIMLNYLFSFRKKAMLSPRYF